MSEETFHVTGANAAYGAEDAPWDEIAVATHLHLGGPEFMAASRRPACSPTPARTA